MERQKSSYRWVVFITVLLNYFLVVTQRTAPGLITDQLMKDFNATASIIGLLTSVQFLAYASLQIPIGILSDRFGPNLFLVVGTIINGLGTLIYSVAPNEIVLFFARLLVGIGDATIWINLVLILSQWFKAKEFVGLLGLAGMSGSLGFLVASVPFTKWISLLGWRPVFFITGTILSLFGILLYFILVKKPKQIIKNYSTRNLVSSEMEDKRETTIIMLGRIFRDRQAWAAFLCHFGVVGTYLGFIGSWAVPYGMQVYGLTRSDSSQLIMISLVGAIIGAPLTSWISGRLESTKRPYVVVHMIVVVCWAAFLLFSGKPPFSVLVVLFLIIGYGMGASTLTFAVVRQSFALKEVGVVTGFANTGGFLSAVLLPSIFGKLLDHFYSTTSNIGYHYGFVVPVVFSMFGLIGGILIRENREKVKQPGEFSNSLV